MNTLQMKSFVDKMSGRLELLHGRKLDYEKGLGATEKRLSAIAEAGEIVRQVAQATQREIEYQIGQIVTVALASVFDDPYELKLDFVMRRGRTECDILFEKDDELFHPLSASGGGAVDVASFALRIALWSVNQPRTRPVLILDEPMKLLSRDRMPQAGTIIKELSKKLGIQMIIVSHADELIDVADKVFKIGEKK